MGQVMHMLVFHLLINDYIGHLQSNVQSKLVAQSVIQLFEQLMLD